MAKTKTDRAELYKDHLVQVILSKFLSGEVTRLEPVFDFDHGYRYPLVEAILGNRGKAEGFLEKLSQAGILGRELHDKVLFCPSCTSPRISMHYNCPHCKSFNVRKSSLMEHLRCGYIDVEDRFKRGGKLVCPRCGKELAKPEVDYRKAGIWCSCNDCKKSFDIPVPSHFCRNCKKEFTFEDAIYTDAFAYTLSEESRREASLGRILVMPIKDFLVSRGFEVETPGFLKGKSGANHMFDLTAFRKDAPRNVLVIDLASSAEEVSEQSVIAMFAKIYDVTPDKACLVAIPGISENGTRMAKLYNITVIEAKNAKEAIKSLADKCPVQ
jgi:hypothetical protein